MLEELRKVVYEANLELPRRGLVTYTWGNVSGIDRDKGLMVIKPSGVEYSALRPEDLVVLDMNGNRVEGALHPSSDAKRIWSCIGHSLRSEAWCIRTASMRWPGHRPDGISRATAQHMRTISTGPGALRARAHGRGGGRRLRKKYRNGHR